MLKLFTTLIGLSLLSLLPGFISGGSTGRFVIPDTQPTPNATPEIERVTLSENVAVLWCPTNSSCPKEGQKVKVSTVIKNSGRTDLDYYYIVTGGKIVGEGSNVVWEFEDNRPDKYEITVGVGKDNVILGKTITKTIDVRECADCEPVPCECPTITILGPKDPIKSGDLVIFEAKVEGGFLKNIHHQWSVPTGTIVAGQDRVRMIVKAPPEKAENLTVNLIITGICAGCPNEASKTILLKK